jgi:conjugative transfer pilus assembly protein TraH
MLCALLVTSSAVPASAGVQSEMNSFFSDLGGGANVTGPAAYQGQAAGYYTGGGLYTRAPQKNITPVSISLPKVSAGCGGIDIFTGGFSFINSDQLVAFLKATANNAIGFAFKLAIDAISQQIGKVMDTMQDIANKVNTTNISSCNAAKALVGTTAALVTSHKEYICETLGNDKGVFTDFAKARSGCGNENKASDVIADNADPNKEGENALLPRNYTWWAIYKGKDAVVAPDPEFAEFLMTLLGTVVYRGKGNGEDGEGDFQTFAPDLSVIKTMLDGNATSSSKMLKCNDTSPEGCLTVHEQDVPISPVNALRPKIQAMIISMRNKVLTDEALSNDEVALLGMTSVPLYKVVTVTATSAVGLSESEIATLSEVVSVDVVLSMVETMIQHARKDMRENNAPISPAFTTWRDNLMEVNKSVGDLREKVSQRFQTTQSIIERTQMLEKQLRNNLAPQLTAALGFSRSQSKASGF